MPKAQAEVATHVFYVDRPAYEPLARGDVGYTESLVIHNHPGSAARDLVLLVHGLGGSRYGTWGNLPKFLFEDCASYDIGLYDYKSGLRRLSGPSAVLEKHAEFLADLIRDLEYDRVILVGHSMGGLLCQGTIRSLVDSRTTSLDGGLAVRRISGLFLMAAPQSGSTRIPRLSRIFSADARALYPNSTFVTTIQTRFANVVQTSGIALTDPARFYVPTFALVATMDRWVDELGATLGLPRDHIKNVHGTHTSAVKFASKNDDGYRWFLPKVNSILGDTISRRSQAISSESTPSAQPTELLVSASDLAELLLSFGHGTDQPAKFPFEGKIRIIGEKQDEEGES